MVNGIVRGAVSAVAALSIAAGGVVVAGGTAAGQSSDTNAPWWIEEVLSDALGPCPARIDGGMIVTWQDICSASTFGYSGDLGAYTFGYSGPKEVVPGAEATYRMLIQPTGDAVSAPGEPLDVTTVKFLPPKGFEFVGVKVFGPAGVNAGNVEFDSTAVADPGTGTFTVTPPDGGWALPSAYQWLHVDFTVRAPDQRMPGAMSGVTFTGTSVPASDGWVATGTTRVWPELVDTGSSGS